jgi:hypothetical protein
VQAIIALSQRERNTAKHLESGSMVDRASSIEVLTAIDCEPEVATFLAML